MGSTVHSIRDEHSQGRSWLDARARTAGCLLAAAALLGACAATRTTSPSEQLAETLERWRAGTALSEGVEKQVVSPEEEAAARRRAASAPAVLEPGESIWIQSGKSRVLHFKDRVKRVSIGNPDLAGFVLLGPQTILMNAKPLPEQEEVAPAETFAALTTAGVRGQPLPRVAETTVVIWHDGTYDVHTLFVADFIDRQVMLEVTVAEINRSELEEWGIDFRQMADSFWSTYYMGGGAGPAVPGASTTFPAQTGQPELPLTLDADRPVFTFRLPKDDITAFIQALHSEGMASILAQPKLLAMSGQTASFQVGGEIPIRIATSFVAQIQFKPFGTLVNFTPRVSDEGDIILTVTPEVSQPDFTNVVEGIPTFRTRRATTSVKLRNGETLVVGGLLETNTRDTVNGVPYLSDIPFLGRLFTNTVYEDAVLELMVVVTPHLIEPMQPGVRPALPTDHARFGPSEEGLTGEPEDTAGYHGALDQVRRGEFEVAIAGFRTFLREHPTSPLADNAQYWIGECYYAKRDFDSAVRELDKVLVNYENGDKRPGALLKQGYAHLELGDEVTARRILQQVVSQHPGTDEARRAEERLHRLEG